MVATGTLPPGGRTARIVRVSAAVALTISVFLASYTWLHFSPAGPNYFPDPSMELPYRLRSGDEHDAARARNGGNPYILEIDSQNGGSLLYYGASHTSDPADPQVADISARWKAFGPTVALYEGRRRNFVYGGLIEPFAGLPEPALVHKLARRDKVQLYTLEPSYDVEVSELLKHFPADRVAAYFFLRVYSSEAGGDADEDLAADLLQKRTDVDGLRGTIATISELDSLWQHDFPSATDWRIIDREPRDGYMEAISDASRRIRGEHMARTLIELVERGERVFAVVGSGHVIRQEWNLRSVFNQEPAWDQPVLLSKLP